MLVERLRYLDDDESPPDVFAGASMEEVSGKIEAYEQYFSNLPRPRKDNDLVRVVEQANHRLAVAYHELMEAKHNFEMLKHSFSWKLTKPLRVIVTLFKSILRQATKT